ncbi:unnamed protein product [Arctogadus glacialis]
MRKHLMLLDVVHATGRPSVSHLVQMVLKSTWVCIGELELAILNLQRNETMVAKVYDLLHLVWKTYHCYQKKGVCQLTVVSIRLFCATWTTLPPQQPVLKFKGVQRSCVLQKNDLILPQAISALRKTVMVLQAMQETPQRGGMLCQFMECLQGQEEISFQLALSVRRSVAVQPRVVHLQETSSGTRLDG